jgi:hypothetical protein
MSQWSILRVIFVPRILDPQDGIFDLRLFISPRTWPSDWCEATTTWSVTTIVVSISLAISKKPIQKFDRGHHYPEIAILQPVKYSSSTAF